MMLKSPPESWHDLRLTIPHGHNAVTMKLMAETQTEALPPVSKWAPVVALAWLIPGGGHFLLKRAGRGAVLAGAVAIMFLLGLMMRGALFYPQTGDILTTVIYVGGFIGNLMSGIF